MRHIPNQKEFEKWLDDQPAIAPLALPLAAMSSAALDELPPPVDAEIKLGIGTFEIDSPLLRYLDITGTHQWYSKIRCHQPLRLSYLSPVRKLTLLTTGDHAALNIDHAAYADIDHVIFANLLPPQDHTQFDRNDIMTIKVQGKGIEATPAHDGDSSYGVSVSNCSFPFLEYGIDVAASAVNHKGFAQLLLWRPWFNGTRFPVRGVRMGECHFMFGLYQLYLTGIELDGNANTIFDAHFERPDPKDKDVHIAPGSHGTSYKNKLLWNDPQAARILDEGEKTIIRYGGNRNMSNAEEGGGKKKVKAAGGKRTQTTSESRTPSLAKPKRAVKRK